MSGTDIESPDLDLSWRQKALALYQVAKFQPKFATGVVLLSLFAATLEGFGLSFLLPIIELAQGDVNASQADGLLGMFVTVYDMIGIPFTLGALVVGVVVVMILRFTSSFLVSWFRAAIETRYVRFLQQESFDSALDARVQYFDAEGSDEILNAIVTQAEYAGKVIKSAINTMEQGLLALVYLVIALYFAPVLTILTVVFLGGVTILFRNVIDAGYSLGDSVAESKEQIQENAQAGTQGVRDVKLFGMTDELRGRFNEAVVRFERSKIRLSRNEALITNFYQLTTAVSVFVLIYVALTIVSLQLGSLGVFLFAIFRLGPRASNVNRHLYRLEGELPHLIRTQAFLEDLSTNREQYEALKPVPDSVQTVSFQSVWFSYAPEEETVLCDVSFEFDRGEFVAFVGASGAGKSTIVSLIAQMYHPDSGTISANGTSIADFDIKEWREHVSVVRQDPHIFNDSLRWNVTIGNRDATQAEIEEACEIAKVTEFLKELPDGYDTVLGDQGVRLSGGQRQRIAIARALLKDADLLVLDEATSDLDTSLEKQVHEGIESMNRDYAILVVAHRLSTVTNADRIYAMEDGQISAAGPHEELLAKSKTYERLYGLQSAY